MFSLGSLLRTAVTSPRRQQDANNSSWVSGKQKECQAAAAVSECRLPALVQDKMCKPASPLARYIYLNGVGAAAKERFIATCRKNFLVYILMVDLDESRPSGQADQDIRVVSASEFGNGDEDNADEQSQADSSAQQDWKEGDLTHRSIKVDYPVKKKSKLFKFIKKIIPSKAIKDEARIEKSFEEANLNARFEDSFDTGTGSCLHLEVSKNFIKPQECDIIQEIHEFSTQIEESETAVRTCLVKYVQDKTISKELVNAASTHGCLLQDATQRASDLTTKHWVHQVEQYKVELKQCESSINSLLQQNRNLIKENDILTKKNEQLSTMLHSQNTSPGKSKSQPLIEDLTKNNNALRAKMNHLIGQISNLEETVKMSNKRSQLLQQQLNNTTSQLHNYKVASEKNKAEYDIQIANLTQDLQRSKSVIAETADHESVIIKDLEMLQMQLQPITQAINWDRFQKTPRTLPELIHLNRSFINELGSALIYKQKELNISKAENESLNLENCKIALLKDEVKALQMRLEQYVHLGNCQKDEIQITKEQLATSEIQMSSFSSIIAEKDSNIESKESIIKAREEEINNLNEVIISGQKDYSKLQFEADRLRHENNALQTQIKGMAQVLTATGAGDIAKELANTQEKLTAVQTQFFALAAENNILMKQIEANKSERQILVAYQKNCYEQLQVLHKEIETMEKSNDSLKDQLDTEKQTVNALQTERVRHLEERTILTAIYERLKSEISKVDQLEGAVTSMNRKASKLAMIAEYNKQLGEKLQNEVAEKDEAINELQNNVKQLNSFQMESTKEKVALCEELNKVFSVKEVLNTKLTAELEKNVILDESKKEIQNNANLQLKEIQAAYNREHAALKNLVRDVKQLVVERDSLLEVNKEKHEEYLTLVDKHDKLVDVIKNLQGACKEKDNSFYELEAISEKQSNDIKDLKKTHQNEINYINAKFEITANQVESLKSENGTLRNSLEYLQNDVTKLRHDLEQSRENEVECKKEMDDLQSTYNNLYHDYKLKSNALQQIIEENSALKINVYSLGEKYKCLTEENERMSRESSRMENMLAEKYQNTKIPGLPTPKYVENVLDDINARDEEILVLQDRLRDNDSHCMELSELLQTVSENRNEMQNHIQELEQELNNVLVQLEAQKQRADENEEILEDIKRKTVLHSEYQTQQQMFTTTIENLKREYDKHIEAMEEELSSLRQAKEELTNEVNGQLDNVNQYKEAHEKLQKAHRLLALKLFSAVRVLICEKVALEVSEGKFTKANEEKDDLQKILESKESELNHLTKQVSTFRDELDSTKCENASLFEDMQKARQNLEEIQEKLQAKAELESNVEGIIKKQQECITTLKSQLEANRKSSDRLQMAIASLEEKQAEIEFEKSETELRIHELQMQTQTEVARCDEMKQVMQKTLELIIEMKEHGRITPYVHNQLLQSFSEVQV